MGGTLLSPERRIGAYLLLERLGAGGLGEVWKARDRRLNRVVALKFITAEARGSTSPYDLLREARAASSLNHPNILTIFEVGESEGRTFLAMEFVEGETLRARLNRSAVPMEEAREILNQVAAGLAVAHRHGIVHRDLKPENVMLRVDGYVKLVDFGLAKVVPWSGDFTAETTPAGKSTDSGVIVGTLTYMSPEQARAKPVTPASDVFSFGIMLYEIFTGDHPFKADTAMDTLSAILSRQPPRLSARNPACSAALGEVCARALEKEPGRRFPSAIELAAELKAALAAPSAAAQPAEKLPVVRHKPRWMQVVGATLIAALLILGVWRYRSSSRGGELALPARSVAVMNLRTAGDDQRAQVIAQDLPEELTSALAKAGLQVASRSSVAELGASLRARDVGAQLGVDSVLEGNVRSYGSKVKVYVELVDTRTGFQKWSGSFTAEADDPLASEQKLAAEIAAQLQAAHK
jgi:serine/threonine protein kinase